MASVPGRADGESTRRTASRFGPARTLGRTGWSTSAVGYAAHRAEDDVLHARALRMALEAGINVVAVGDGPAGERLAGRVIAEAIAAGTIAREDLVVVLRFEAIASDTAVAEHCARLGLAHVDAALLRIPDVAALDGLGRASAWLQARVDAGELGAWGVSCPGLAAHVGDPRRIELDAILAALPSDGPPCAVLEVPFNLLEPGAAIAQGGGRSAIERATDAGLGVLLERPLRAMPSPSREVLLFEPKGDAPELALALAAVRKLEAAWAGELGRRLRTATGDATDLFRWGQLLSQPDARPADLESWQRLRHEVIGPHVGQASAALLAHLGGDDRRAFASWWRDYGTALHGAFTAIERDLAAVPVHRRVANVLATSLPDAWRSLSLAAQAVGIAASQATTLLGMHTPAAVADILPLVDVLREAPPLRALATALDPIAAQLAQDPS